MSNRARNVGRNERSKLVAGGLPAPSCTVVGAKELEHYQHIVENHVVQLAESDKMRREQLREISENRVSNWSNTIDAQRQRKDQAKVEREERDEQRRRVIDAEEAELRRVEKERAVQRANLLLYDQNDRVKNFTSKLFLATVLEEREKQLAIKDEKLKVQKQLDAEWEAQEQAALRAAEIEELRKSENIRAKRAHLRDSQLAQLAEIRTIKIRERDSGLEFGQRIKEGALEEIREEKEAIEKRRLAQHKKAEEFAQYTAEAQKIKDAAALKAKEDDERIAQFTAHKQEQLAERKKRADEQFGARLEAKQKLNDIQAAKLAVLQAEAASRELRSLRDIGRERAAREESEAAERARRQKEITQSRNLQLAKKQEKKEEELLQLARMKDIWNERAEILINEELQEQHEQRSKVEQLQHFHLLQRQEKRHQALLEKRADIEEGINVQMAMKEEHELYNAYVNSVMSEYVRKGRGADLVKLAASRSKAKSA